MSTHIPVLLNEMLEALSPKSGELYLDATFGGGGYTRAILEAAPCRVVGIDRDPDAIKRAAALKKEYPDRFDIFQATFSTMESVLKTNGYDKFDGIIFDFGVSSFQLDEAERGFSFRFDGPLDMRMSGEGLSAADIVNTYSESDIADIIYRYGEERKSRRIARAIVEHRQENPILSTKQLADLIKSVIYSKKDDIHPATLSFQGLRIFVNNELIEIEDGLNFSKNCLNVGGRLIAVTFHSLEDRLVKTFLRGESGRTAGGSRYLPETTSTQKTFKDLYRKGKSPSDNEITMNPRSRSARLRAGEFLGFGG